MADQRESKAEAPPSPPEESSVQVSHGERIVGTATITQPAEEDGPVRVALHSTHQEAPAGVRADLVDAVLAHPGVGDSDVVHVVAPIGDVESIGRLRERTTDFDAHPAGASSVIDAQVAPTAGEQV